MQGVFQALLHQMHKDESHDDEVMEDSTDIDNTMDPDYLVNQARSQNKGDSKLEKVSEISPGHPARAMSSREGRNWVRVQEAKSRNPSEKSYKTQSNWLLSIKQETKQVVWDCFEEVYSLKAPKFVLNKINLY